MKFSSSLCLAFVLLFTITLSACSPAGPAATPTAAVDTKATSDAAFQLTTAAIKAEANQTATAEKLSEQKQLTSAAQTATAQANSTHTPLPTSTSIPTQRLISSSKLTWPGTAPAVLATGIFQAVVSHSV